VSCASHLNRRVDYFKKAWDQSSNFGGEFVSVKGINKAVWQPTTQGDHLRKTAVNVLQDILDNYGGVWTGCFRIVKAPRCRALVALTSYIIAVHIMADIAWLPHLQSDTSRAPKYVENDLITGYLLSSLGRGILHGDSDTTGNTPSGLSTVTLEDFVLLQASFLKLYIDTIGRQYTLQLDKYLPLAFPPEFHVVSKPQWRHLSWRIEPVYTSLRNLMFSESGNLIDFGPYRPLVAFPEAEECIQTTCCRRGLIDVGSNCFLASPVLYVHTMWGFLFSLMSDYRAHWWTNCISSGTSTSPHYTGATDTVTGRLLT